MSLEWEERTVKRGDQEIFFKVAGEGPLVVMFHGGLGNGTSDLIDTGIVEPFAEGFQIAVPDSLGHGRSSKPADPALYQMDQRAADNIAVVDALGVEKAWFFGYSMGGWTCGAMAKHYPERCAGMAVAGWDLENGMYTGAPPLGVEEVDYDVLIAAAKAVVPQLVEWITPEVEPGLREAINAINSFEGAADAVAALNVPVLIWAGYDDPYHDPMLDYARRNAMPFLSTPGDHTNAGMMHGTTAMANIAGWIRHLSTL
ncbi:MAG: alpha/beta fold hydrolase [Pseudomonadota bacterium]